MDSIHEKNVEAENFLLTVSLNLHLSPCTYCPGKRDSVLYYVE